MKEFSCGKHSEQKPDLLNQKLFAAAVGWGSLREIDLKIWSNLNLLSTVLWRGKMEQRLKTVPERAGAKLDKGLSG